MAKKTRTMTLVLDRLDYDVIQNEIARRQAENMIPDGKSSIAGAILAEVVRDLQEYRDLFKSQQKDE